MTTSNQKSLLTEGQINDLVDAFVEMASQAARVNRGTARWNVVKRSVVGFLAVLSMCVWAYTSSKLAQQSVGPSATSVALVEITGEIVPGATAGAEKVVPLIEDACKSDKIASLVIKINSPGGAPSEAERIISALDLCRSGAEQKRRPRPVYAVIDGAGASAAYMIAMHADRVYAGRYSLVGSIGAIMRYNDLSGLASKFGVKEQAIRSAPLKGGPSLVSGITPAEASAYQQLVDSMARAFLEDVKTTRGNRLHVDDQTLFSGRVWTANEAMRLGLIDEIQTLESLKATRFKDMPIFRYRQPASLAEAVGLKSAMKEVALEAMEATVR